MDEEKMKTDYEEKSCVDAESEAVDTSEEGAVEPCVEVAEGVETEPAEAAGERSETVAENVDNGNNFETSDVAKLIEEAESRGYLRGRNEKIEELMGMPGMYRPRGVDENCAPGLPAAEILANMRRSVWD